MSRNDQLLVKEHNGNFYVFDVMAESWGTYDTKTNTWKDGNVLYLSDAAGSFKTREAAHDFAHKLDEQDEWGGSEYGVVDEVLFKDGAPVTIIDTPTN